MGDSRPDEVAGRLRLNVDDFTDDEELRREGWIDQLTAKVKRSAERLAEKVEKVQHRK